MKKCSRFAAILLGAASIAYADSQVFRFGSSNSQADVKEIDNAIRTVPRSPTSTSIQAPEPCRWAVPPNKWRSHRGSSAN